MNAFDKILYNKSLVEELEDLLFVYRTISKDEFVELFLRKRLEISEEE